MSHIRSVTADRTAPPDGLALPSYAIIGGTAKADFRADINSVISTFLWRKKYEPLPGT